VRYEIRPVTTDEVPQFRSAVALGFGRDSKPDGDQRFISQMPVERTVAAFDGDQVVGTLGDFELLVTVPGGAQVPMAGMTMVGVRATHTRQGILRSMVQRHLDNAMERGEPLAGLWASEPGIYGRFGFGLATECYEINIDARRLKMDRPSESVEISMISADELLNVVAPFWSQVATQRSGFIDRSEAWWEPIIADPEYRRGGMSASRHVVARRGEEVVGYLQYRQKDKWSEFVADGSVSIITLVGSDAEAERALWFYATDIDLFPNVDFWDSAFDDQLPYEVADARSVRRVVVDTLYLRILDVEAALTARKYETDGELILQIQDGMDFAAGTYRLKVEGGVARVVETTDSPDVTLDVRELGAIYLGRVCVGGYFRSGLIEGEPAAVRRLGRLFVTDRTPWCPEMF
jgi:predicted acetyltransferase